MSPARRRPPGLFITGTDTGVGKTYVAARIAALLVARGVRVGVYKPVASGCGRGRGGLVSDDAVSLWEAAGRPGELEAVCPQRFAAPLSPPRAARLEGRRVDPRLLRAGLARWTSGSEIVLVEGSGGLMSPVSDRLFVADLAAAFGFPLVVVASNRLGAINQVLQTLITASTFREGIPIAGVVLNAGAPAAGNDASRQHNRADLERYCVPPVLAELGWRATSFDRDVDWMGLAAAGTGRPRRSGSVGPGPSPGTAVSSSG